MQAGTDGTRVFTIADSCKSIFPSTQFPRALVSPLAHCNQELLMQLVQDFCIKNLKVLQYTRPDSKLAAASTLSNSSPFDVWLSHSSDTKQYCEYCAAVLLVTFISSLRT